MESLSESSANVASYGVFHPLFSVIVWEVDNIDILES
jgi:hypothetical protein